jgi:hypothetical protein
MIKHKLKAGVLGFFALAFLMNTEAKAQVQDYLQVPGPVIFHKQKFNLAWSSHPNDTYYKHEYVKAGEKVESYKEMVMLEFLEGNLTPKEVAANKVKELENRKNTDPLVNYDVINSPDGKEYIVDFIMSTGPADASEIVEWNAYRYKQVQEKSGKTGLLLMAISRRAYGNESTGFLKDLKTMRPQYREELSSYKLPEINLGKK